MAIKWEKKGGKSTGSVLSQVQESQSTIGVGKMETIVTLTRATSVVWRWMSSQQKLVEKIQDEEVESEKDIFVKVIF